MNVGTRLSVTSALLVLLPSLLIAATAVLLVRGQATESARHLRQGMEEDAKVRLLDGVRREHELITSLTARLEPDARSLAGSEHARVLLGAADAGTSPAVAGALAALDTELTSTGRAFTEQAAIITSLLERNLVIAEAATDRGQPVALGEAVERQVVDQVTRTAASRQVPALLLDDRAVPWIDDPAKPCPVVDGPAATTRALVTIFVRLDEAGTMVRVATSVVSHGRRAVGTAIPPQLADGRPNPVLTEVLAGRAYSGLAWVVDRWCLTAYRPLRDLAGRVVGMLFVGVPVIEGGALGKLVTDRNWGAASYAFVADAGGRVVIHPRADLLGKHLLDDLKLDVLQPALAHDAAAGTVQRITYPFEGRNIIASWLRLPQWGWTIFRRTDEAALLKELAASARANLVGEMGQLHHGSMIVVDGRPRPLYNQIRLLDVAGREVVNLQQGRAAETLGDKGKTPWFLAGKDLKEGEVHLHPVEVAANTGAAELRAITPVVQHGRTVGYSVTSMDWSVVQALLANHRYGTSGFPWIIGADGLFLTHPTILPKDGVRASDPRFGTLGEALRTELPPAGTHLHFAQDGIPHLLATMPLRLGAGRYVVAASVPAEEVLGHARTLENAELAAAQRTGWLLLVITIVVSLLGVALGRWLAGRLTRPLAATEAVLGRVADGDLGVRLGLATQDEYGRMSAALDRALAAMAQAVAQVGVRAGELAAQSSDLTRIGGQLDRSAGGSRQQADEAAAAAEEVATSANTLAGAVQELEASVQEIARGAQQAAADARGAAQAADGAEAGMRRLAGTAGEIGSIVALINGIAEQVNLLALNATIEAARAGEAGRGFAVVAGEVKELARRVQQASSEIGGKVGSIQGQVQDTAKALGAVGELIKKLDASQQSAAAAVEEQAATTQEMARSVQQTAQAATAIAGSVAKVADGARTTAEAAQQANAAAARLQGISGQLTTEAQRFRTG